MEPKQARRSSVTRQLWIAAGAGVVAAATLSGPALATPVVAWTRTAAFSSASKGQPLGGTLAISADGHTLVASVADHVVVYAETGRTWSRRAMLTGATVAGGPHDEVAVSANGSTILIGEPGVGQQAGAVLDYVRSGGTWRRRGVISNPNVNSWSAFGWGVSIAADGNTALIGTSWTQQNPEIAEMFYTRTGQTWRLAKTVWQPSSGAIGFGGGVLSADGKTALINWGNGGSGLQPSAIATFIRSGSTWSEQGPRISVPITDGGGAPAAISANGTTALITSPSSGPTDQGRQVARVAIFARTGGAWTQRQVIGVPNSVITPPEPLPSDYGPAPTAAISSDAHILLIGSPLQDVGRGTGLVYTETDGTWVQTATLPAPGVERPNGQFVDQVALSGAGSTAVLAEPGANDARGMLGIYASHVMLTHAQWVWLRKVFIPAHYAPTRRARAWTGLTSNPTAAFALVERYAPAGLR